MWVLLSDIFNNLLCCIDRKYLVYHKCTKNYYSHRKIRVGKGTHRLLNRHNLYRIRIGNWGPKSKQPLHLLLNRNFHICLPSNVLIPLCCKFVLIIKKVKTRCAFYGLWRFHLVRIYTLIYKEKEDSHYPSISTYIHFPIYLLIVYVVLIGNTWSIINARRTTILIRRSEWAKVHIVC